MKTIPFETNGNQGLFIFIGQAGCQVGSALWQLFNAEHFVQPDGFGNPEGLYKNGHICFYKDFTCYKEDEFHRNFCYNEVKHRGKYVPRTLFIDFENTVINEIKAGSLRKLFSEDWSFNEYSNVGDGASIFPRAYNNIGRYVISKIMSNIRIISEKSERLNVVNIARSYGGGTGSGLGSLLLESLHDQYSKMLFSETNILNFGGGRSPTVEPYNTLFGIESSCSSGGITFIYNNSALKNICSKQLRIKLPLFYHMNELLCHTISGIYSSERFPGYGCCNLQSILTNLVPYPRIQLALCSMSPIVSKNVLKYEPFYKPVDMINCILNNENAMCDINLQTGSFISSCIIYRGLVSPFDISDCHNMLQKKRKMRLVDWNPRGIKSGHSPLGTMELPDFNLGVTQLNLTMLSNHTNISDSIAKVCMDVHIMVKKKAFLHWYLSHGMEEDDFKSALENAMMLSLDYREIDLSPDYVLKFLKMESSETDKDKINNFQKINYENIDLLLTSHNDGISGNLAVDSKVIPILSLVDELKKDIQNGLRTMTEKDRDNLIALAQSRGIDISFLANMDTSNLDGEMLQTLSKLLDKITTSTNCKSVENEINVLFNKDEIVDKLQKMTDEEKAVLISLAKSNGIENADFLLNNGKMSDDQLKCLSDLLKIKEKEKLICDKVNRLNNMTDEEKAALISSAKANGIENVDFLLQGGKMTDDQLQTLSNLLDIKDKEKLISEKVNRLNNMTDEEKAALISFAKSNGIENVDFLLQGGKMTDDQLQTLCNLLDIKDKDSLNEDFEKGEDTNKDLINPISSEIYKSAPIIYENAIQSIEPEVLNHAKIHLSHIRCALSTDRSFEESFTSCISPKTSYYKIQALSKTGRKSSKTCSKTSEKTL